MMDAAHSNMQILTFRIQTCSVCAFQIQILTFVVGHLLGLHGKGSHHKTHVDFWLLEDCACWRKWVCLWARAGLPAYDQGVLVSMRTVGERKFVIKLVHQPAVCVEVQISLLMLPHTHTALPLLLEGVCERESVSERRESGRDREYACVCVSMYACVNEISGTHPLSGCLCLPCHWSCLFYIPSISLSTSPQSPDCHPINSSVPLHVSASMSLLLPAPVFSPIRLSRSVSLSVWWGMGNCTLLHRKRQRQRRERWGKRGGQNSREGKREEEEEMRKLGEERGEGEEKRKRRQRQIRRIHKRQGRQSEEARGWEGKTVKERDGVRWGVQEVRGDKGGIDWSVPPFAIQQANSLSVESAFAALSLHARDCVRVIILLAGGSWTKPSTCGTATSSETLPRICQRLHRHAVSDMFLCSSLLMNSSTTHTHAHTEATHHLQQYTQESDASLQHSPTHTCTPYSHQSRLTPWCPLCYTGCSDWQAALMPLMAALIEIPHMALVKKTIYSWAIAVVELRPSRPMIKSLGHGIH